MLRILFILVLIITSSLSLRAGEERFSAHNISSHNGLSHNSVNDVLQDSHGFLWMATADGLCRYDGYDFLVFSTGDVGLSSNMISSIVEDHSGNIWIGTANNGVFCYLRAENRFVNLRDLIDFTSIDLIAIPRIAVDSDGAIWCNDITLQLVVRVVFDSETNRVVSVKDYSLDDDNIKHITAISATQSGLYLGTRGGIYRYNKEDDRLELVKNSETLVGVKMITQRDNTLFVSNNSDLISIDLSSGVKRRHLSLASRLFYFCWVDDTIWIAATDGLYTSNYNHRQNLFGELNRVDSYDLQFPKEIIKDHTDGVWVAFQNGGITRYSPNHTPFIYNQSSLLNSSTLQTIETTDDDRIFVGDYHGGLFYMDGVDGAVRVIELPQPTNPILSICSVDDAIYVATRRLLYKISGRSYDRIETIVNQISIRKVIWDGEYLWIASYDQGVLRYHLESGRSTNISTANSMLPSNIVRDVIVDSRGWIWLTTSRGVAYIDDRTAELPSVRIFENSVEASLYTIPIMESGRGEIWFGTAGNGIGRLSRDTTYSSGFRVALYSTGDGLDSGYINTIEEDNQGSIWFSTSKGLSQLIVDDADIRIKNFDSDDGIEITIFSELASTKMGDGTLVFGGCGGFTYFNPISFQEDVGQIIPVISDFKIEGESIAYSVNADRFVCGSLNDPDGIRLDYDKNNFSIKFAALHYSTPSKYRYSYLLDGVDRRWMGVTSQMREVNYTNLKPGGYRFYLRVADRDGKWCKDPLVLPIYIEYPMWQRWYAIVVYAILLLLTGYFVILYFHNLLERRNEVKQADFERSKMAEMLEMRTRFFTNVSHEFRTPLTLIISPLQRMMSDERIAANREWSELLNTMSHNGDSLMRLVNEFLSYTKQESGELSAQLVSGDIIELTRRLFTQFKFWADLRGVTLQFSSCRESISLLFDPYLMEQIIYNLCSNAIKHTPSNGVITMSVEESDRCVTMIVKDSGCGIAYELQPNIFERYFSHASEHSKVVGGTGVGLFLTKKMVELHGGRVWFDSTPDVGTTFYVEIPKSDDVQSNAVETAPREALSIPSTTEDNVVCCRDSHSIKPTLLVVDDNIELAMLVKSLFCDGYTVLMAHDGVDGVEVASRELPDIIISDVMMPRMDGVEMCERLKGDLSTSHIPIIMLSAKSSADDIVAGLRASADGYCPKPFNNAVLRATVDSTLANRRRAAERVAPKQSDSLIDMCDSATTNIDKVFLTKLISYIEDNIDNSDLSSTQISDRMGLSLLVLNKKLKSLLGMTIVVFVRTVRIRRAAELLRSSRNNISSVTYDVGFSDLKYFRRCFKDEYGITPQEYKNKYAESEV